jgi:hypothetical protein
MRPLVALRRAAPYDPRFLERSALLWPLRAAAGRLAGHGDFPPSEALGAVFEGEHPVRFVPATPRPRRRVQPRDPRAMYDGTITLDRCVPTRARCWHDLMNALVWGTFPRAKAALHARQHRAIADRVAPGSVTLPNARTPELDALALLDEGGVVVLAADPENVGPERLGSASALREGILSGSIEVTVFGHAIFESVVLGVPPAVVAAIVLPSGLLEGDRVRRVDRALATALEDSSFFRAPSELHRVDLRAAMLD